LLVPLVPKRPGLSFRQAVEWFRQPDVRHLRSGRNAVPSTIIDFRSRPWPRTFAGGWDEPAGDTGQRNPQQEQHTRVVEESPEQRPERTDELCHDRKLESLYCESGLRYNSRTSPRRADRVPARRECRAGGGLAWRSSAYGGHRPLVDFIASVAGRRARGRTRLRPHQA
jgi:hypothetical protein